MLTFLLTFSIYAVITSTFIISWYNLTRHTLRENPNNSITAHGYIFKWWSVFFEKVVSFKQVYYEGAALEAIVNTITLERPVLAAKLHLFREKKSIMIKEGEKITPEEERYITNTLAEGILIKSDCILFLYETTPVYRFPAWIREPLSACPVCMASVYGSLFWLLFIISDSSIFEWCSYPVKAKFVTWPVFCIVLSFLNKMWVVNKFVK